MSCQRTSRISLLAPPVRRRVAMLVIGLILLREAVCLGQLPAVPAVPAIPAAPAGVPTIWNKLGFQGGSRIKNFFRNLINRRGNFPGLEGKPKLTSITDPANKESDNPAIKEAANAKAEQDGAGQKVKAIKYLATLGCSRNGCFPGVKDALLAAFEDCTEEVRYEAVKAFIKTTGNKCNPCRSTCCDKDTTDKLYEMAYGRDDQGCYLEISPRVRREAKKALMACCSPGEPGPQQELPTEGPQNNPEEGPETPEPPMETASTHDSAFTFVSSLFSPEQRTRQIDRQLQRRFAPQTRPQPKPAPRRVVSSTYTPRENERPRTQIATRPRRADPLDISHTDPSEAARFNDGRNDTHYESQDAQASFDSEDAANDFRGQRWRALVDRFGSEGHYAETNPVEPLSGRPTRPYTLEDRQPPVEDNYRAPEYDYQDAPQHATYEPRQSYQPVKPAASYEPPEPREPQPRYEPSPVVNAPYRPGSTRTNNSDNAPPVLATTLPRKQQVIEQVPVEPPPSARQVPPIREKIESTFTPPMPSHDEEPVGPSPQPKTPPVVPSQEPPHEAASAAPVNVEPELPPSPKPIDNLQPKQRVAVRFGSARPLVRYGAVRAMHQESAEPVVAEREQPVTTPDYLKRASHSEPQADRVAQRTPPEPATRARVRLGGAKAVNSGPTRVASQPRVTAPLGRRGRYASNRDDSPTSRHRESAPSTDRYADYRRDDSPRDTRTETTDRYQDRRYAEVRAPRRGDAAEVKLNDPRSSSISIDDRDAGNARVEHMADQRGSVSTGSARAADEFNQGDIRNGESGYLRSRVQSWFR